MADTVLTSASVYRNGCVIKRTGRIRLAKGPQQIRLEGLSASVDESSLRLSVPAGVSGSNVQIEHPTKEQQKEILKDLAQKVAHVKRLLANREKLASLWESNADFSQKESLSIEEMTGYLERLPERLDAISQEIAKLTDERKALEEEYRVAAEKASLPHVVAELTAAEEGEYPIEITYRDFNAYWNPVYEIHAEDGTDALKLRMRAQISQHTKEDWKDVTLKLFTGNPSISGTIPEMLPSHIGFYEPIRKARFSVPVSGMMMNAKMAVADEDFAMADAEETIMEAPQAMNAVLAGSGAAVKNETMTEYDLTGRWDILNGQEILCDIRTDELTCRYHSAAVPKLSDEVYLAAEVNTSDLEEMQGTPASVYLKGAFAGNVILEPDMTKDKYDLSLGVDETMKVKRTQKKRHTSQLLLKGQKKTEYEYEIVITSRKEKEVSVTLTDQIPISDEKSINVEPVQLSGAEYDKDTGLMHWDFKLAPSESKTLTLAYNVSWPKDKVTQER
ncbi:MAG: mucoidy inhibitor MuiA family protein [Firmicutes bacterium]|nr:mucoidy inhibitor MuiA family protein [Bacillota bacterium]